MNEYLVKQNDCVLHLIMSNIWISMHIEYKNESICFSEQWMKELVKLWLYLYSYSYTFILIQLY